MIDFRSRPVGPHHPYTIYNNGYVTQHLRLKVATNTSRCIHGSQSHVYAQIRLCSLDVGPFVVFWIDWDKFREVLLALRSACFAYALAQGESVIKC
jgi:hypothetical protein